MELFWTYARVFLCGGALCLIGQILIDKTSLTPARILVSYVVAGVILGEKLPDWTFAMRYASMREGLYCPFSIEIIVRDETWTKSASCCCVI